VNTAQREPKPVIFQPTNRLYDTQLDGGNLLKQKQERVSPAPAAAN